MAPELLFPLIGLLLVALGWPMAVRRVRPNRWYGLRVPATFADKQVWYDANAAMGRDTMALGGVIALVALVLPHFPGLPAGAYPGICVGILGVGSLAMTVRGWRLANRLLRQRRGDPGAA